MSPGFKLETRDAASLLDGLVSVNLSQMGRASFGGRTRYPILRGIQTGRVRYERYDPNEHWKSWGELTSELANGGVATGDCEDLSSAVVSELMFGGIPARTLVYKSGPRLYHVVVKTDRWGVMDPSRAAGMEGNGAYEHALGGKDDASHAPSNAETFTRSPSAANRARVCVSAASSTQRWWGAPRRSARVVRRWRRMVVRSRRSCSRRITRRAATRATR